MPISYSLMPLSDLFVLAPNKSPDWVNSTKQAYVKAVNAYCGGRCSLPSADKPPLKLNSKFTPM